MPVIFSGSSKQQFSFCRVMGAGLLHIYMFAGCCSHNCCRGMPMVWCRYKECIKIGTFQQFAYILYNDGFTVLSAGYGFQSFCNSGVFNITDIAYFGTWKP